MPRPPRLHVSGGFYHVMLRGNHREALFATDHDRWVLNEIIADTHDRLDVRIHAFCWMTNHLHIVMQIADRPLGGIVQRIAQRYARYRHKALATTGHLFERRHKAKLIDVDTYFLTLLRYVHLNPVKAHLVPSPCDYPWSSHRAYLGLESIPWLTNSLGLSLFSCDLPQAYAAYKHFISQVDDDVPLDEISHPDDSRILGSDRFLANIPTVPYRPRSLLTLEKLADTICHRHGASVSMLRSLSRARHLTPIRTELACRAVELRIATLSDVARFLGRDPSALTQLLARYEGRGRLRNNLNI